jgi:hypothetical protein
MTTYRDIAATLNNIFAYDNSKDIWWNFDSDNGVVLLNVYYETRDAANRFYELFGRNLPGMNIVAMKAIEPFATTMTV